MRIFLAENGQKTGPFDPWEVRGRLDRGEVTPRTLGWHEGCENWMPLKDLPALGLAARDNSPGSPPPLPDDHRESTGSPPDESHTPPPQTSYPDADDLPRPWSRFLARMMDMMIWFVLCLAFVRITGNSLVGFVTDPVQMLVAHVLMVVPEALCLSIFGTTPGKALLGLRVEKSGSGGPPERSVAWQRALVVLGFGNGFYLSYLAVAAWIYHYVGLMRSNSTWWDRKLGLRLRGSQIHPIQIIRFILAFFAINMLFGLIMGQENAEEWMRILREGPAAR